MEALDLFGAHLCVSEIKPDKVGEGCQRANVAHLRIPERDLCEVCEGGQRAEIDHKRVLATDLAGVWGEGLTAEGDIAGRAVGKGEGNVDQDRGKDKGVCSA